MLLLHQIVQNKLIRLAYYLWFLPWCRLHTSQHTPAARHPMTVSHCKLVRVTTDKLCSFLHVQWQQTQFSIGKVVVIGHYQCLYIWIKLFIYQLLKSQWLINMLNMQNFHTSFLYLFGHWFCSHNSDVFYVWISML